MENLSHSIAMFGPFVGVVIVKQLDVATIVGTYTAYNFGNVFQMNFDYSR